MVSQRILGIIGFIENCWQVKLGWQTQINLSLIYETGLLFLPRPCTISKVLMCDLNLILLDPEQ